MPENPFTGPEWQAYVDNVERNLVPQITNSGASIALVPKGPVDVEFATQLGFMVTMDKPIIAVVAPGSKPSKKLVLVADAIVELDMDDPDMAARLAAAIKSAVEKIDSERSGE